MMSLLFSLFKKHEIRNKKQKAKNKKYNTKFAKSNHAYNNDCFHNDI
jgi:hypothetical protein